MVNNAVSPTPPHRSHQAAFDSLSRGGTDEKPQRPHVFGRVLKSLLSSISLQPDAASIPSISPTQVDGFRVR